MVLLINLLEKQHRTFPNLKANLVKKLNEKKVKEWICANTNLLVKLFIQS